MLRFSDFLFRPYGFLESPPPKKKTGSGTLNDGTGDKPRYRLCFQKATQKHAKVHAIHV